LGVPLLPAMLAASRRGHKELEPVLVAGSLVTGIAVLLFAFNVLAAVKSPAAA
jgi:hypothetical protein